jgi:hypothetical protein
VVPSGRDPLGGGFEQRCAISPLEEFPDVADATALYPYTDRRPALREPCLGE